MLVQKKPAKARKRDIYREIVFNGLKVRIVSRTQLARYLGFSIQKLTDWESRGYILPPALVDSVNTVNDWNGNEISRKFYLFKEAQAIRILMRGYKFGKRIVVAEEFIERVLEKMQKIREELESGSCTMIDYALVLEFSGYNDLKSYLEK